MFLTRTLVRDLLLLVIFSDNQLLMECFFLGGIWILSWSLLHLGMGAAVLFSSLVGEEERWERIGLPMSYLSFCLLLQLAYLLD